MGARNELLNALACLEELEKSITSVHHIPPKTMSATAAHIVLDQPKYLNASQDNNDPIDSIEKTNLSIDTLTKNNHSPDLKQSESDKIKDLMERLRISERSVLDVKKENDILKQSLQASVLQNEDFKVENHKLKLKSLEFWRSHFWVREYPPP